MQTGETVITIIGLLLLAYGLNAYVIVGIIMIGWAILSFMVG